MKKYPVYLPVFVLTHLSVSKEKMEMENFLMPFSTKSEAKN